MRRFEALLVLLVLAARATHAAVETETVTLTIDGTDYITVGNSDLEAAGLESFKVIATDNAAADYLMAGETYWPLERGSQLDRLRFAVLRRGWTDESAPLAKYLKENENALALIEKASTRPRCRFPILRQKARGGAREWSVAEWTVLPQLPTMRELTRLLVVKGRALEFEGQHAKALDAYMCALRIGGDVAQDPIYLSGLVGHAYNAIGLRAIETSLVWHELDDKTLAQAQKRAHELAKQRPNLAHAMRGERIISAAAMEYLIKNPSWCWKRLNRKPRMKEFLWASMIQTESGSEQARQGLRAFWDVMEAAYDLPLPEYLQREDEIRDAATAGSLWAVRASLYVPSLLRAPMNYGRDDLHWTVLDVEFALARYKAKHGTYPQRLDELKPLMLGDGIDPFSGKPLRYRLEDDGSFTIWSVGENLTDDGGRLDYPEGNVPWDQTWQGDDYIWSSRLIAGDRADQDR